VTGPVLWREGGGLAYSWEGSKERQVDLLLTSVNRAADPDGPTPVTLPPALWARLHAGQPLYLHVRVGRPDVQNDLTQVRAGGEGT
jgi:hypothetical protein